MDDDHCGIETLEIDRIIGFNGCVRGGLQVHPDNKNLIFPLGCNVVIEDLSTGKQAILSKHTNYVTCIAVDPTGRYIATGQVNYMGFKAPIIVWDYESKRAILEFELHKVKVEALAFSADSKYLFSLGGRDCGAVAVWDLTKGAALCGSPAQVESAGITTCLSASLANPNVFVTGGNNTLRVWELDAPNRKIRPTDVNLGGGLKRDVLCIELADYKSDYPYMFCGTTTGDILGINMKSPYQLQFIVPKKDKFSLGVTALSLVSYHCGTFDFLVGTGDGLVGRYEMKVSVNKRNHIDATWKHHCGVKAWQDPKLTPKSGITSIAKRGGGHMFFVGTENCQFYKFNYAELTPSLVKTCHSSPVNDAVFAFGYSELLVTCSFQEVRIWNTATGQELCRFVEPNMTCNAICITRDGSFIYSAWDDGKIRALTFKKEKDGTYKLKEKFVISDTHNKGVTAIAATSCGSRLVTGGGEGQVRVWQIVHDYRNPRGDLVANMKEHKGKVTSIQIHPDDRSCVSASTDGSTIIWDLETNSRSQIVLANTLFKCVCFGAKGVHILTSGTDHKIGYWEVQDGSALRELEGSKTGAINTMDISSDGTHYITGGEDRLLKLWKYNEGQVTHAGIGHSDQITKARICPNSRMIISCGADGAILMWRFPACLDRSMMQFTK